MPTQRAWNFQDKAGPQAFFKPPFKRSKLFASTWAENLPTCAGKMTPPATPIWVVPALVVAAYLIGCLSPGWFLARIRGVDLRNAGSGATGATNAGRVLGKGVYAWVLLLDALKAFVAVYGSYRLFPSAA